MKETKANILIVDDTPANLHLLNDLLKNQGYKTRPMPSGPRALASVEKRLPDMILLDIMMPEMDGYEVCRQLMDDERTKDIPIIFISALDEVFDKVKAFNLGGADYITKPFQAEEVIARVETHLAIRNLIQELETKNDELNREITIRKEYEAELERLAIMDPLTNIYNRRFFFDMANKEIDRSKRYSIPLSLILFDIDHFKKVNDTYGHLVGDQVLINLAKLCQETIRSVDIFARYGGEEFILLMPDSGLKAAQNAAERLREAVAKTNLTDEKIDLVTTISLGVNSWEGGDELDFTAFIDQADQALYQSKENGRNQVSIFGEIPKF